VFTHKKSTSCFYFLTGVLFPSCLFFGGQFNPGVFSFECTD
jgi:hypothetical protein